METDTLRLEGDYAALAELQKVEEEDLLRRANVVGVAVGHKVTALRDTEEACLTLLVSQKLDPDLLGPEDFIPETLGRFRTDVVETGAIFAGRGPEAESAEDTEQAAAPNRRSQSAPDPATGPLRRPRPVGGGYSVGHPRVSAGTLGVAVIDRGNGPGIPGKYYILSNNHVLANTNDAQIGDPVLQPGAFDGGRQPDDAIGQLSRYVPIDFRPRAPNLVDAAIAEVPFELLERAIHWIGHPRGIAAAGVGEVVQKTGRSTHWTTGRVTAVNATVRVHYGNGRTARFARQIVTSPMGSSGDSGSLVLNMRREAVGLLFAGSSRATLLNPILYVLRQLGIALP